jgi:hypothetical protein
MREGGGRGETLKAELARLYRFKHKRQQSSYPLYITLLIAFFSLSFARRKEKEEGEASPMI